MRFFFTFTTALRAGQGFVQFTDDAVKESTTRPGVPAIVNVLGDRCLLYIYSIPSGSSMGSRARGTKEESQILMRRNQESIERPSSL